jgi:hypothetical protein
MEGFLTEMKYGPVLRQEQNYNIWEANISCLCNNKAIGYRTRILQAVQSHRKFTQDDRPAGHSWLNHDARRITLINETHSSTTHRSCVHRQPSPAKVFYESLLEATQWMYSMWVHLSQRIQRPVIRTRYPQRHLFILFTIFLSACV